MDFRRGLLLIATLLLLAPLPSSANGPAAWVVATYAYPQRDRAAAIQPLADYLGSRGGHPVRVVVLPSPTALVEALHAGRVDVAVPNLHAYLQARPGAGDVVALPVPDVPAAQADRYRAVLVARAGIDSVAALQRQAGELRLVLVGRDSASGGFVPTTGLREMGLDPRAGFASLAYAGSHAAALQSLVEGRADVVALAADVYDAAQPDGVHELWRSAPIPPGPLLCRNADTVPCDAIAGWLLEAHARDPLVMAALRAGWPEFGDAQSFTAPPSISLALPDRE
ncbi:PhnD/SsuA/transferrin family substrate-binding protein [Pseudoxanthomonas daejeonensis]|uniref:phosphate/phosphite/phosphonate ABC transporter substrate-binding protein n=1 Tax=Pseudoxanthomonas daejeonensis TaxID=266062 RepID=UPI001F53F5F2|nr:PhnD/SsuA/transferrin family substrate-binding protein [Pseudoxanthomonas daejeonensis]UNK58250.1 PhnD/SsuA/transferrin family substrate-binding protein [Pseudoxanthomonas daejeonensis]